MRMLEICAQDNGAHRNQTSSADIPIPEGWAVIPEDMLLENFPFGDVTAEELEGVMTVTGWTAGKLPEPETAENDPAETEAAETTAELQQLRADMDYIAVMTGVEL